MEIFLAIAVFILMVAAPFLVVLVVAATITGGAVVSLSGLVAAKPARALVGALIFSLGIGSGLTLLHWVNNKPTQGDTKSPHALVHDAWRQTRLRLIALQWMADGTFEKLADQQRQRNR